MPAPTGSNKGGRRPPQKTDPNLRRDLQRRIEQGMAQCGFRTRDELGKVIGVEGGLLGMKLNAKRGFSVEELASIADALDLSLHYLVFGEGPARREDLLATMEKPATAAAYPELMRSCLAAAMDHNKRKGFGDDTERITKHTLFLYTMALKNHRDDVDPDLLDIFDTFR